MRKYWRKQRINDKFVLTTFNKRGINKIRTRSNNQYLFNLIYKLKEKKKVFEECLLKVTKGVIIRERLKKAYLDLEYLNFSGEKALLDKKFTVNRLKFFGKLKNIIQRKKLSKMKKKKKMFSPKNLITKNKQDL